MLASRFLAAALLVGGLTFAAEAAAEDVAAAKALFSEGLELMQAGNFEKGCPALRESYRLDPRIGTLFTLAECEAKWGRIATAVAHYSNFLTQVAAMPQGQRIKQKEREKIAQDKKDELSPQVPELTLTLPDDAPQGTVVKRNGVTLAAPSLGVALPVDPGEQVITTQAPGGDITEKKVTIEKGQRMTVKLVVSPPEPGSEGPEGGGAGVGAGSGSGSGSGPGGGAPVDSGSGQRIAAFIVGGVGVAGLAVGGIMGGLTLAKRGELDKAGCFDDDVCNSGQTVQEDLDQAKLFGWVSTVGFGVGVAGLGVATVLLLTAPSAPETTGRAAPPGRRTRDRRWMTAGVLEAGPAGAVLGVRGGW